MQKFAEMNVAKLASAAAVVVIVGGVGMLLPSPSASAPAQPGSSPTAASVGLASDSHNSLIQGAPARPEVQSPVWSPDGRRIAFVSRRDGKALYVMNADGSGLRIVARVERLATPAWSPDGRRIAFEGGQRPSSTS